MARVKLLNMAGEEVGSLTVKDSVFKQEVNEALVHETIVATLANARQGTKSNLSRREVRGHAKKPFAQKHTGNARQGSTKGPHQTGGGNAFAVKPRSFNKKVNKVAKRIALSSALSSKFADNEILFLDEYKVDGAKTKSVKEFANKLGLTRTALVIVAENDKDATRATANIEGINLQIASKLIVYDVLKNNKLVITKEAVKVIEEGYAE